MKALWTALLAIGAAIFAYLLGRRTGDVKKVQKRQDQGMKEVQDGTHDSLPDALSGITAKRRP